jgi:hypothetical protein
MSTVTYSNPDVQKYISDCFLPIQINVVEQPDMMDVFNASWTPTIIVHDAEEQEHRRMVGFFDPKKFIEELSLGRLKAALDNKDFSDAKNRVAEAMDLTKGDPDREPEALYWAAITNYKASHNADDLKSGWLKLLSEYPESQWAHRAEFIKQ